MTMDCKVEYKVLDYIAKQKDLQVCYQIIDDHVLFAISGNGATFYSKVKYEKTEEFRLKFLDKALRIEEILINGLLLKEIHNLLDKADFREETKIETDAKPDNVFDRHDGIPNKLEPKIKVNEDLIEETKPEEVDMKEVIEEIKD